MSKLNNIRAVLRLADRVDMAEGVLAYERYNDLMRRLSVHYHLPLETMAAVFVATSPNNNYMLNLRSAISLVDAHNKAVPFDNVTMSTYRACGRRAWRCLEGEDFLSFTKGKKTRAFYRNIIDPSDPDHVTIDGHMIAIWAGRYLRMKDAGPMNKHYDEISDHVKWVAHEEGLIPCQLQAVLWFTWKRIHKPVKGDGQMSLFTDDDHWGITSIDPLHLKPFETRK